MTGTGRWHGRWASGSVELSVIPVVDAHVKGRISVSSMILDKASYCGPVRCFYGPLIFRELSLVWPYGVDIIANSAFIHDICQQKHKHYLYQFAYDYLPLQGTRSSIYHNIIYLRSFLYNYSYYTIIPETLYDYYTLHIGCVLGDSWTMTRWHMTLWHKLSILWPND